MWRFVFLLTPAEHTWDFIFKFETSLSGLINGCCSMAEPSILKIKSCSIGWYRVGILFFPYCGSQDCIIPRLYI